MYITLFLALIIVLVSGFIAYIGDWVGRKMGRKRLTLFGLRPRYTAIVISVSSGMFIALLTLFTIFVTNAQIRDRLTTPIELLRAQLSGLRVDYERQQHELDSQRQQVQAATTAVTQARVRATTMQFELANKTKLLSTVNTRYATMAAQQRKIQQQLTAAKSEFTLVDGRLRQNQRQLDAVRRDMEDARAQLVTTRADYDKVQQNLSDASSRLVEKSQELLKLEATRLQLEQTREDLNTEIATLTATSQALAEIARTSFAPPAFAVGQELVTALVPTTGSETERRALITRIIAAAERVVRQHSPNLPADTSALIFIGGTEEQPAIVTRDDAINAISARVASFTNSPQVIVRLAPVNNVPENGRAWLAYSSVTVIANDQVYGADAEVAHLDVTVSAGTSEAELLGHLADDLLRDRVPAALRERGVVMVTRRFDAQRPLITPEASVARVSWADLLRAANTAAALRGDVRLIARTRQAMYRFDALDLVLDVVPRPAD